MPYPDDSVPPEPGYLVAGSNHANLSVGNVHLGAAAFTGLLVTTVAAYLKWLAGVDVPPEVLLPTVTLAGTAVGWAFPSN